MNPVLYPTPPAEPDAGPVEELRYPMLLPLRVSISMPGISLRELSQMRPDDVLTSERPATCEAPLYAANVALSWGEFELVDDSIALRLTRLAG